MCVIKYGLPPKEREEGLLAEIEIIKFAKEETRRNYNTHLNTFIPGTMAGGSHSKCPFCCSLKSP